MGVCGLINTAPPRVLRPKRVPCGPLRTCMLERSKVGILEPKDGNGISAKYVTTPGEASLSGTCQIPRKAMEAFSLPPLAPAWNPGVTVLMSAQVRSEESRVGQDCVRTCMNR